MPSYYHLTGYGYLEEMRESLAMSASQDSKLNMLSKLNEKLADKNICDDHIRECGHIILCRILS